MRGVLKSRMADNKTRLVYSTENIIPKKEEAGQPEKPALQVSSAGQRVRVRLDRKGRGGKSVTLIEGLVMSQEGYQTLLKKLKTRLGTGGALKDGRMEIQGDHRDALIAFLEELGYRPKLSGG